jgi:hypothetical protein
MAGFLAGEGVGPVADFPRTVRVKDLDHVKPHPHTGLVRLCAAGVAGFLLFQHRVPFGGGQDDPALFFPIHRIRRGAVCLAGAGFHLHEHQFGRAPDAADQIHLASVCRAEVLVKNFVSRFSQKNRGPALALPAEPRGLGFPPGRV